MAARACSTDNTTIPNCLQPNTAKQKGYGTALRSGMHWTGQICELTVDFTNETQNICKLNLIWSLYFEELTLLSNLNMAHQQWI